MKPGQLQIFARDFPDTDFISVGNESDVRTDRLQVGKTIEAISNATAVRRVVDRDIRTPREIEELRRSGVRVLSLRHLEAYLLDDEILSLYCEQLGQSAKIEAVLAMKQSAIDYIVAEQRKDSDDIKSAAGLIYNGVREILRPSHSGSNAVAFMRDIMTLLITPDTSIYRRLEADIFGD